MTGSTDTEPSNRDPRITEPLDPRLKGMAEKLLQPILNSTEDKTAVFDSIEEEPIHCQFEPSTTEEMTVNQAKQILKHVMVNQEKQTTAAPEETPVQKEADSKLPEFDIDNFRMCISKVWDVGQLVQEYRSAGQTEGEIVTVRTAGGSDA